MKRILVALMALGLLAPAATVFADGCYMCEGGGYVKYKGDDNFAKRKEAEEKYGCKVSGTTGSCNGEKGTVGLKATEPKELIAKKTN